jgi:4-amino-4-deoxy-L-arabinose transferase-like glycosyltransferase
VGGTIHRPLGYSFTNEAVVSLNLRLKAIDFRALGIGAIGLLICVVFLSSNAALIYMVGKYQIGLGDLALGAVWTLALFALLSLRGPREILLASGIVLAAAIALRLGTLGIVDGLTLHADPQRYSALADHFLAGEGLWVEERFGVVRGGYPPVYPMLLGVARSLLGDGGLTTLILNSLVDLLAALAIWRLAGRFNADAGGKIVALAYLLLPTTILSAPLPQKEGLTVLLITCILISMADLLKNNRGGLKATGGIGVLTALLALTQPGFATLSPLLFIAFFMVLPSLRGKIFRSAVASFLICCLAMSPWWIRNYLTFGSFIPLTTVTGIQMWVGATRAHTSNIPLDLLQLPEPQNFKAVGALALEAIAANPIRFVAGSLIELGRGLSFQDFAVQRLMTLTPELAIEKIRVLIPTVQFTYIGLLALSVRAFWSVRRSEQGRFVVTALGVSFVNMACFQMWFEFVERHRQHLIPILMLLVAVWLSSVIREQGPPLRHQPA